MNKIKNKHSHLMRLNEKSNFIDYYKESSLGIIRYVDLGKVSRQDGCYTIAGFMHINSVSKDPRLENICLVAEELEIPDKNVEDVRGKWKELKGLINKL